jgi:hypothetical protein
MKPTIDGTKFGSITVDGETYDHDIVIRLSGKVGIVTAKVSVPRLYRSCPEWCSRYDWLPQGRSCR